MTSTKTCSDFTSKDCNRNHICSWPKFKICTTLLHFDIRFPDRLSAYFPAIIQLMLIVYQLLTVVVFSSISYWWRSQTLFTALAHIIMVLTDWTPESLAWLACQKCYEVRECIQSWSWRCGDLISFTSPLTGLPLLAVRHEVHQSAMSKPIKRATLQILTWVPILNKTIPRHQLRVRLAFRKLWVYYPPQPYASPAPFNSCVKSATIISHPHSGICLCLH